MLQIRNSKKAWWAPPGLKGKIRRIVSVPLLGTWYEFGETEETALFVALLLGERNPWKGSKARTNFRKRQLAEEGFRQIVHAIFLQIQQTAASEVTRDLLQEISEKMRPLVFGKVSQMMDESLQRGSPRLGHRPEGR